VYEFITYVFEHLLDLSTLALAIATAVLAYYAYKNMKVTQSQLGLFQEQTNLVISQNFPILTIENFSFQEN